MSLVAGRRHPLVVLCDVSSPRSLRSAINKGPAISGGEEREAGWLSYSQTGDPFESSPRQKETFRSREDNMPLYSRPPPTLFLSFLRGRDETRQRCIASDADKARLRRLCARGGERGLALIKIRGRNIEPSHSGGVAMKMDVHRRPSTRNCDRRGRSSCVNQLSRSICSAFACVYKSRRRGNAGLEREEERFRILLQQSTELEPDGRIGFKRIHMFARLSTYQERRQRDVEEAGLDPEFAMYPSDTDVRGIKIYCTITSTVEPR